MKTKVTELFGIEHPVVQGGMVWFATHELVSAVSEAGGLGLLAAGSLEPDELAREIELVRERTEKPFGVNVPLINPLASDLIDVVLDRGVGIIFTSAGSPKAFTPKLKEAGCKVVHVVASAYHAKKAADAGCDAVVAEGYEGGGHVSHDEVSTMVLTQAVCRAVGIPVIAAGGFVDGRGLAAALCLGASGVQMGTRFVASVECAGHPDYKKKILEIDERGTVVTGKSFLPVRVIKNRLAERIIEAERSGADPSKIIADLIGEGRTRLASIEGDLEEGSVQCGQSAGLVWELVSVKEIVESTVKEAEELLKHLAISLDLGDVLDG